MSLTLVEDSEAGSVCMRTVDTNNDVRKLKYYVIKSLVEFRPEYPQADRIFRGPWWNMHEDMDLEMRDSRGIQ